LNIEGWLRWLLAERRTALPLAPTVPLTVGYAEGKLAREMRCWWGVTYSDGFCLCATADFDRTEGISPGQNDKNKVGTEQKVNKSHV
jgi:hypothetical protein